VVPEFLEGVAHAKSWIGNIRCSTYCYGRPNRPSVPVLIETIRQLGIERGVVGAELSGHRMGITVSGFLHVQQELPGLRFVDVGDLVWEVRRTKSPQELKYLKTACDISQAGFQSGLEAVHPGMTERELAGIILSTFYREGADSHGFAIQSGAKGMQVRDGTVSDFPLQRGHFMKWDGGAWYRGYKTDFCRMVALGEPTERQREGMDASFRGNTAAKATVRAGVTIDDVCRAADRTLEGTGFNHYWNALGHGIGQGVHEEPMLWRGRQDELMANDFLAIEFNVVDPEHFEDGSFTFEDNFRVTHEGIEMFTGKISPQLIVID
jgi:Xaa-Pro aminopeptidase